MNLRAIQDTWYSYTNEKTHPYINQGVQLAIEGVTSYCTLRATSRKNPCYGAMAIVGMSGMQCLVLGFVANKIACYVLPRLQGTYIYDCILYYLEFPDLLTKKIYETFEIKHDRLSLEKKGCSLVASQALSFFSTQILSQFGIVFSWKMTVGNFLINVTLNNLLLSHKDADNFRCV